MTKYLTIGALSLVIALGAALWFQTSRVTALRADNMRWQRNAEVQEKIAQDARIAQEVAEAYRRGSDAAARALAAEVEAVVSTNYGGCADAAIDADLLRDIGGLR